MLNLAICFNQVSLEILYTVIEPGSKTFILIDGRRLLPGEKLKGVTYFNFNNRLVQLSFFFLSFFGKIDNIYVPHQRVGIFYFLLNKLKWKVSYIDDGMDTLRDIPKNFDIEQYGLYSPYYTFTEYTRLGNWLRNRPVKRVASVSSLSLSRTRKVYKILGEATLIIESPGVTNNVSTQFSKGKIYLLPHPSYIKRQIWGDAVTVLDSELFSPEKTILNLSKGVVIIGETMVLMTLLYSDLSEDIEVFVFLENYKNLSSLVKLIGEKDNFHLVKVRG